MCRTVSNCEPWASDKDSPTHTTCRDMPARTPLEPILRNPSDPGSRVGKVVPLSMVQGVLE